MVIKKKPKPKERDWFAEFRGKTKLSEQELNLLKTRLNMGKLNIYKVRFPVNGYALTQDQIAKGKKWLVSKWKTASGKERLNCPYGYREMAALDSLRNIRLIDFYNERGFHYPVYRVVGTKANFEYYVRGGEIQIVG